MKAKQIVIANLILNYYQNQSKAKSTLLFLHGWRSDSLVWQSVVKQLGSKYQTYCLDLPGFGQSHTPQEDFDLDSYSRVVRQFIDKLKLNNIVLIGHSFGGAVAIKTTIGNKKVKKLVLVDSSGIRAKSVRKSILGTVAKIGKPIFSLPLLKSAKNQFYQIIGSEDYLAAPELKNTFVNIINDDLTDILQLIKQPVLLIWGNQDKDTPINQAIVFAQKIPHAKLEILKKAGHYSFLDQTQEFTQILTKFVNS